LSLLLFLGLQALAAFSPEAEERLTTNAKRTAYKSILFGLCFYHSLLLGRKKFGTGIGTGTQQVAGHPCTCMCCAVLAACCILRSSVICLRGTASNMLPFATHAGSGSGLGFCRNYSFNTGDLTTCGDVLINYLEAYEHIPWDDLRYVSMTVLG
jgi:dynein heavy chain